MSPMDKKDFILLKAIFDEALHNALLNENLLDVEEIFKTNYSYEINENMVNNYSLSQSDILNLKKEYIEVLRNDDLSWGL